MLDQQIIPDKEVSAVIRISCKISSSLDVITIPARGSHCLTLSGVGGGAGGCASGGCASGGYAALLSDLVNMSSACK